VDKVKSVTDNDQRKLICQFGLLQEVLHPLGIIAIALSADSLHLLDLSSLASCLNILEVNLRVLGEVDNGTKEVEQTLEGFE